MSLLTLRLENYEPGKDSHKILELPTTATFQGYKAVVSPAGPAIPSDKNDGSHMAAAHFP